MPQFWRRMRGKDWNGSPIRIKIDINIREMRERKDGDEHQFSPGSAAN